MAFQVPAKKSLHIHDLSEDCLLHIFSFITNVREKIRLKRGESLIQACYFQLSSCLIKFNFCHSVCKMWTMIVYRSLAYHHTHLTQPNHIYFSSEIDTFQTSNCLEDKYNAEIELKRQQAKFYFPVAKILLFCRNLRKFHNVIGDKPMRDQRSYFNWDLHEDTGLWPTLQLTEIKIWNDEVVTDDLLAIILSKCPKLESLDICGCPNVIGSCLHHVHSSVRELRLVNCPIVSPLLHSLIKSYPIRNIRSI
jgi:hypothetical protein